MEVSELHQLKREQKLEKNMYILECILYIEIKKKFLTR